MTKTREDSESQTGIFEKNTAKNVLTYDTTGNTWNLVLDDEYVATEPSASVSTFTNVYLVDNDILEQVSRVRFEENNVKYGETVDTIEKNIIDYGRFVTSLYVCPFNIPESMRKIQSNIILGIKDTEVKAPILNDYKMVVDLGSIQCDRTYKNVYDFINTSCTLSVPYFDTISLANEYAIGQTISATIMYDLYTGNATLNVVSTFTGNVVYSTTRQVSMTIPFVQDQNNTVVSSLSKLFTNTSDHMVLTVVRNNPYGDVSIFGHESKEEAIIGSKSGFIKVNPVELVGNATSDEKDKIKDLLNAGVFQNVKVATTKARKSRRKVAI